MGWVLMVVVNTLLIEASYTLAPTAQTLEVVTDRPRVSKTFTAPIKVSVLGEDILEFGEYQYDLYTNHGDSQLAQAANDGYQVGFPLRAFAYSYQFGVNADGGRYVHTPGALLVQGKHIPLVPNGFDFIIPYGGLWSKPLLYILNTAIWSVIAYLLLIVNTRMRLRIRAERKRKKMKRLGLCVKCGYRVGDFTTCPECGAEHARARSGSDLVSVRRVVYAQHVHPQTHRDKLRIACDDAGVMACLHSDPRD